MSSRKHSDGLKWGGGSRVASGGRTTRSILFPPHRGKKPTLHARRIRARLLLVSGATLFIVCLIVGLGFLSHLSIFQVGTFAISGTENISPKIVRAYAETILNDGSWHLFSRNNVLLYPRVALERDIQSSFPRIKSASVSRSSLLAQAVRITVVERTQWSLWCDSTGKCFLMDSTGFIYAEAPAGYSGLYTFHGDVGDSSPIGKTFIAGYLNDVKDLLTLLAARNYTPIGADVIDDSYYVVVLNGGPKLFVPFSDDPLTVADNLASAMSSQPLRGNTGGVEYIDLRYGNRVYYKMVGGSAVKAEPQNVR